MNSHIRTISANTPMPDLLGNDGYIRLLPAAELDLISPDSLRLWAHHHARYLLPTRELISWLGAYVNICHFADQRAIEIGSGAGDLAHYLGIKATDSLVQTRADVALMYIASGQPLIKYPPEIEHYDALEAVRVFKPKLVIGAWITNYIDPRLPPPPGGGSIYGVKEDELLDMGVTYICIGNEAIHAHKRILQRKHHTLHLPFVRSRSTNIGRDVVWIWD